ncbi:MAG: hypothetical protein IKG58_03290 [Bacilli bacterium]|nr:hypothetical protein [Bacilli bacterium]MBR3049562.1 hypothetical protein [Bacilli bacterium]
MKKLFIYYSLTNNGDVVANTLKKKGYEIRKVISKSKYPRNKFLMIMMGGYKATFNKKDKLLDFNKDINNYDKVVIGSPIWNDRLSAPINKVISLLDLNNKDIDFILYSSSGKGEHAKDKIKDLYNIEPIILKEPKKNNKELDKIKNM